MVERRRTQAGAPKVAVDTAVPMSELRSDLSIDREGLDECLERQPELFHHAADSYVVAVAMRDQLELDIKELTAKLDQQLRKEALEKEEKVTEAGINKRIQGDPDLIELQRRHLEVKVEADKWQALKEAYHQRSYMLRELVALFVSRMRERDSYSGARGEAARTPSDHLADQRREEQGKLRRERRGQ